jgi:hypothetical protein
MQAGGRKLRPVLVGEEARSGGMGDGGLADGEMGSEEDLEEDLEVRELTDEYAVRRSPQEWGEAQIGRQGGWDEGTVEMF